jgi:predicted DNA-binding transcriptional regulator YafY
MKAKKYLPRTDMPRIYFIDRKIASGRFPNTASLAKEYDTSMSTISRDIAYMKLFLNAPIEYDALRRGYYYAEKNFRLSLSFTTAEEALALGMAKNLLAMFENTPLYDTMNKLLEEIIAPARNQIEGKEKQRVKGSPLLRRSGQSPRNTGGAKAVDASWPANRIIVPPPPAAVIDSAIWETIVKSLGGNRVISFNYRGAYDNDFRSRRVRPYQLLFDSGVWFLYGYDEDRKAERMFSLPRMREAALLERQFILPNDYDYQRRFPESSFGVFGGAKKYRFKITFWYDAAMWVRERRWAADQTLEDDAEEDAVTIAFTSTQYDKVLEWVLSKGCLALPLEPKRLVDDWKNHISEMAEMAGE